MQLRPYSFTAANLPSLLCVGVVVVVAVTPILNRSTASKRQACLSCWVILPTYLPVASHRDLIQATKRTQRLEADDDIGRRAATRAAGIYQNPKYVVAMWDV